MTDQHDDLAHLTELLREWRPLPLTEHDPLDAGPSAALAAVLDVPETAPAPGDPLPPLWHWTHFLHWPDRSELGPDGHPLNGHFLPPLPDRRRMFAGGRLTVHRAPRLGVPTERTSRHLRTDLKRGRSGPMAFVTVRSELRQEGTLCAVEEQDIVYRSGEPESKKPAPTDAAQSATTPPTAPSGTWQLPFETDPQLLFRISALTANTHRIHYDDPYVRDVEHYPGLVVHGPLLAWLMLEPLRREGRAVASFSYRLHRALHVGTPLLVTGNPDADGAAELSVVSGPQTVHATARAEFA